MADRPAPKLALVEQALRETEPFPGVPESSVRQVLNKYAPSIAKRARAEERSALFQAAGAQAIEDFSQLAQIRAERDARPTAEEERKHAVGNRWRGRTEGVIAGMVVAMGIMLFVVAKMNEQTRASTEAGVMIGTAATSQSGEPLVSPNYNRDYTRAPREPGDASN